MIGLRGEGVIGLWLKEMPLFLRDGRIFEVEVILGITQLRVLFVLVEVHDCIHSSTH